MSKSERRLRLTAARKLELYLATRSPDDLCLVKWCKFGASR